MMYATDDLRQWVEGRWPDSVPRECTVAHVKRRGTRRWATGCATCQEYARLVAGYRRVLERGKGTGGVRVLEAVIARGVNWSQVVWGKAVR